MINQDISEEKISGFIHKPIEGDEVDKTCKQNVELETIHGYLIPYDYFVLYEVALFAVFIQAGENCITGSN